MPQAAEFQEFYAANEDWLRPYAVFSFLRDLFGTAQHWRWGALSRPTPQARLLSPLRGYPETNAIFCAAIAPCDA